MSIIVQLYVLSIGEDRLDLDRLLLLVFVDIDIDPELGSTRRDLSAGYPAANRSRQNPESEY